MYGAKPQAPNRAAGLLAVLGGGIILASCFLPSNLSLDPNASPPYSASDYHVISLWQSITSSFNTGTSFDYQSNSFAAVQPHYFAIAQAVTPLVMAVLILLLGIWSIVRRPGLGRSALFSAVVVMVILNSFGTLTSAGAVSSAYATISAPLLSLGAAVLLLGVFVTLVAAFLYWGHSAAE